MPMPADIPYTFRGAAKFVSSVFWLMPLGVAKAQPSQT